MAIKQTAFTLDSNNTYIYFDITPREFLSRNIPVSAYHEQMVDISSQMNVLVQMEGLESKLVASHQSKM